MRSDELVKKKFILSYGRYKVTLDGNRYPIPAPAKRGRYRLTKFIYLQMLHPLCLDKVFLNFVCISVL